MVLLGPVCYVMTDMTDMTGMLSNDSSMVLL